MGKTDMPRGDADEAFLKEMPIKDGYVRLGDIPTCCPVHAFQDFVLSAIESPGWPTEMKIGVEAFADFDAYKVAETLNKLRDTLIQRVQALVFVPEVEGEVKA